MTERRLRMLDRVAIALIVIATLAAAGAGDEPVRPVLITDRIPFGSQPVDYHGPTTNTALQNTLSKIASLDYSTTADRRVQLRSVLDALGVPVESQLLVFSRTALNQKLVSPSNPRSVFFNDEVYVGWVPGAASIEIAAMNPDKGALFYSLTPDDVDNIWRLERESSCITCHAIRSTFMIPGPGVRSYVTDATGKPVFGYANVDETTEFDQRWGGWYVTGDPGTTVHLGNVFGDDRIQAWRTDASSAARLADVSSLVDTTRYLSPHSDIVAHLVFDHQIRGQNLMTRVIQEDALNVRSNAEELLVRHLLLVDAVELPDAVTGLSGFRECFEASGGEDKRAAVLRQLELRSRTFRYPLSWLVMTRQFDHLPERTRNQFYYRLLTELSRDDARHYDIADRRTVAKIILGTKPDVPQDLGGSFEQFIEECIAIE